MYGDLAVLGIHVDSLTIVVKGPPYVTLPYSFFTRWFLFLPPFSLLLRGKWASCSICTADAHIRELKYWLI